MSSTRRLPHHFQQFLTNTVPPLAALVIGLFIWEAAVIGLEIPRVLLPAPSDVALSALKNRHQLLTALGITAAEAICGFALSLILGISLSIVFAQSTMIRRSLFPYAIFLQTVPIVAVAPLVVIWCGEGFVAVVVIALIVSLFPVITNGTAGMLDIPRERSELFELYRASAIQRMFLLRLPGAVPSIVTGARISSGLAALGAIVGEYFAGAGSDLAGLGYLIFAAKDQFDLDTLFAAVLLCTALGVALFAIVGVIGERVFLRWRDRRSGPR